MGVLDASISPLKENYPFARQMIRERLAGRPLARERRHSGGVVPGFRRGDFGGK
jgi:hypothetical protein